jgi:hypothetical protein
MSMEVKMPSGVRWSGQLIATVAVCAVAIVIVAREGIPTLVAVVRPAADPAKVDVTTPLLAKHQETSALNRDRLRGRYLFFPPQDWKRKIPPPPPPPPPPKDPPAPVVQPPPVTYTGPKPIGMLGATVFFEGGKTIELGKESEGVTVVEIVSTWELKLKHKEKVYDVSFGTSLSDDLFKPSTQRTSIPGITISSGTSGESQSEGASGAAASVRPPVDALPNPAFPNPPAPAGAPAAPGRAAPPETPVPPAAAGSPSAAPGGSSAPTGEAPEIPPPLTKAGIQAMTRDAARQMVASMARLPNAPGIDEATKSRLKQELEWLGERLRQR